MCDSATVKALVGPVVGSLSANALIAAPYGSLLRVAEGLDSIRNLAGWSLPELPTAQERAAAVVCGVSQFGGILWLSVILVFVSIFTACSGFCGVCCLRGYRFIVGGGRKVRAREKAIDEVLTANIANGTLDVSAATARRLNIVDVPARVKNRASREERTGLLVENL